MRARRTQAEAGGTTMTNTEQYSDKSRRLAREVREQARRNSERFDRERTSGTRAPSSASDRSVTTGSYERVTHGRHSRAGSATA